MDNSQAKEVLFGRIKLIQAKGGFQPDQKRLRQPFESDKSELYWFCTGCGAVHELTGATAEKILNRAELVNLGGEKIHYLSSPGCILCDGKKEPLELRVL